MTNNHDFILHAMEFDGKGGAKPVSMDEMEHRMQSKQPTWYHFDADHPGTQQWLDNHSDNFDEVIINSLLERETRPRVVDHNNGLIVILRGVNLQEGGSPEDMISIRIWVDKDKIISTRLRKLKAVQDIRESLDNGTGPKTTSDFIVSIVTRLLIRMEKVLTDLDDRTDTIEERILDKPTLEDRHDIVTIRKQAIIMRRYIAPQKEAVTYLKNTAVAWFDDKHRRHLQENWDRITRYIEDLDAIRERAQIVKDEIANIYADKMNKNMYVLSIIAAIFLPLGFFTGLLGINVGGMPGADFDMAFWVVCGICVFLTAFLGGLFRMLKWI